MISFTDLCSHSSLLIFSALSAQAIIFPTKLSLPGVTPSLCTSATHLAPSAINAQPWRVVKTQNVYHFFETHKSNSSEEERMIKKVDLGIAISHFHQTAMENGLVGKFEKMEDIKIDIPENTTYIISWVSE